MSSGEIGGAGGSGAAAGSTGFVTGCAGLAVAGVAAGTPRCGKLWGFELNEEITQATPARSRTSGMRMAHQGLGEGGAFEGIPPNRHSSHSPR